MDKVTEFEWIDHYFGEVLCQKSYLEMDEQVMFLLKKVFKSAREGNLCYALSMGEDVVAKKIHHFIIDPIMNLKQRPKLPICEYKGALYLQRNWLLEVKIFESLSHIMQQQLPALDVSVETDMLSEQQTKAIELFFNSKLMILSGGPGRGKTFTAAKMVSLLPKNYTIIVAAPTGKAANQLYQQIKTIDQKHKIEVKTLHSLLADKQMLGQADVLIVDEASMIDAFIFSSLFSHVKEHTRILIMGDEDQLPSIEAGSVFFEICNYARSSHKIPYAQLSHCYRSDRKEIIQFAEEINTQQITFPQILKDKSEIKFIPLENINERYFLDLGQQYFNVANSSFDEAKMKMNQFRFLTALRVGPFGSVSINQMIHEHLLRLQPNLIVPIMITKTNYELQIVNGEMGFCLKEYLFLEKDGKWISYPLNTIPAYEYAYAISIHKSQGSEYNKISLILPPGCEKLGKQLVYTGVTRAKTQIDLVSTAAVLNQCINNKIQRSSGLSMWLNT